jgi:hypothetical protein
MFTNKFLFLFAAGSLLAWNANASLSGLTEIYQCHGSAVSGTIRLTLSNLPSDKNPNPAYVTRSNLIIAGRAVKLKAGYDLDYYQREIAFGQGAWRQDTTIWIFELGGANLGYSQIGEGFHLEVRRSGSVRGYLGHRDHRQSAEDNSPYDFSCSKI